MTRHLAKILLCMVLLAVGGITFGRGYMMPHRPHHAAPTFSRPKPPVVRHPISHPHYPKPHHPPAWPYWMTFMGMPHFRPAPPPPPPSYPLVYARPPQQVWVAGHYEDQVTIVSGVRVVQRVWIPGCWVTVP